MKQDNPFSLMFGKSPYSIIERQSQYLEILNTFSSEHPSTFAYMITGIRGSGKTVMLRLISEELANRDDWIVIDGNSQDELIQPLSEKLLYEGSKTKLFIDWSINLNAKLFSLNIKNEEKITNPEIIFEKLLKKANENNKKVLITIDEVSSTKQMKKFANFYQSMIGKNYNLFLLMTGLKNNINALINSDASSFLSRTPKVNLLPLDKVEIAREYQKLLKVDFSLAAKLSKLTNGYAFAYQVLGHIFFEDEEKKISEELLSKYDRYLQANGYNVIWKDLTNQEQNLCFAIADTINGSSSDIALKANIKNSNFQNYRTQLIEKGIIVSTGYGKVEFALPRFSQFVKTMEYFR